MIEGALGFLKSVLVGVVASQSAGCRIFFKGRVV